MRRLGKAMMRIPRKQACEICQTMTLLQHSKDESAGISNSPGEVLGLDRAVALSLGAALITSVLAACVVVCDPSTAARVSGWWSQSAEPNVWQQVWQQNVSAGGPMPFMDAVKRIAPAGTNLQISDVVSQAAVGREFSWNGGARLSVLNGIVGEAGGEVRALQGVLLVTQAPFRYRIEEGISILQQLTNWSRHQGWGLEWEAYEAPPSATGMLDASIKTPIDSPSARTLDFGQDFDRAFASVIRAINAERRLQRKPPLSAVADFTTGRIIVGPSEKEDRNTRGEGGED
jgi:hypothetical protein